MDDFERVAPLFNRIEILNILREIVGQLGMNSVKVPTVVSPAQIESSLEDGIISFPLGKNNFNETSNFTAFFLSSL